jgi:stress response protein YsnF
MCGGWYSANQRTIGSMTAEHALVNKTARVVEEVSLKKIGTDHVETVHDKIRRQQVEIERVGPGGKVIRDDAKVQDAIRPTIWGSPCAPDRLPALP